MELVKINRRVVLVGMLGCLLGQTVCLAELKFGDQVKGNENVLLSKHLGVDDPVVISNGYVFVDYEYVPGPYRLQRVGQALTLNGMLVNVLFSGPVSWTNKPSEVRADPVDPVIPDGMNDKNPNCKRLVKDYIRAKRNFLYSTLSESAAKEKLRESIGQLPVVKKTEMFAPTIVRVHYTMDNTTQSFFVGKKLWRAGSSRNSKRVMKTLAKAQLMTMDYALSQSGCVFLTSTPSKSKALGHLKADWTSRVFKPVKAILGSPFTQQEKVKKLLELNLKGMRTKEAAGLFLDRHEASEVFQERLKRK